ncbi:MAG: UDP-N-acetylmuramoyl-L-alanine--D-glutamate ligase [Phycisphaerales bacterium]|nr:UDP-N-acetylmuramoyl-L-alanine--D-glutamate ligase [Phycisphaerales bacterium]
MRSSANLPHPAASFDAAAFSPAGRRITVMGLGGFGGGVGVARWLAACGARVTVTDRAPADKLSTALAALSGLDLRLVLGEHREADFRDTDLLIVNPAVPDGNPFLAAARDAGVPITTEINLFVSRCRGRTVGVTGSVGKSTTVAMIEHALAQCGFARPEPTGDRAPAPRARGLRRVWLGGNIGASLLFDLPDISDEDVVILELSSFQLHRTPQVQWSPHVAAITNVAPNHLDWHASYDEYRDDKLNILRHQSATGEALIGPDAELIEIVKRLRSAHPRSAWHVSVGAGGRATAEALHPHRAADALPLPAGPLKLSAPGAHNQRNAALALAATGLLGVDPDRAAAALAGFAGLPHRLQRVVERDGVTYFNDSKSTTPEAALTAIHAFDEGVPLLVILGGYDKHVDLSPLARLAARRARFAACIGATGPAIADAIRAAGGRAELLDSLAEAVAACRAAARPGDVVLLSPGCASWGQFTDFRERGEVFTRLVSGDA